MKKKFTSPFFFCNFFAGDTGDTGDVEKNSHLHFFFLQFFAGDTGDTGDMIKITYVKRSLICQDLLVTPVTPVT